MNKEGHCVWIGGDGSALLLCPIPWGHVSGISEVSD